MFVCFFLVVVGGFDVLLGGRGGGGYGEVCGYIVRLCLLFISLLLFLSLLLLSLVLLFLSLSLLLRLLGFLSLLLLLLLQIVLL